MLYLTNELFGLLNIPYEYDEDMQQNLTSEMLGFCVCQTFAEV